jgi:hypothetical protein
MDNATDDESVVAKLLLDLLLCKAESESNRPAGNCRVAAIAANTRFPHLSEVVAH